MLHCISQGDHIPSTGGEAYLTLPHPFSGSPHTINTRRGIPYYTPLFLWETPYHQKEERHTLFCPIIFLGDPHTINRRGGIPYSGRPPYRQQEERHTVLWETPYHQHEERHIHSLGDSHTINRRVIACQPHSRKRLQFP